MMLTSSTFTAPAATRHSTLRFATLLLVALFGLQACATSSLGRRQLKLMPESQLAVMGVQQFDQMKGQVPISKASSTNAYVNCVADAITAQVTTGPTSWEVVVFEEDSANAFALPGGKIGVHTGLLKVATTQDQLASVIGHEVAHVLEGHANERVSSTMVAQYGMAGAQAMLGEMGPVAQQAAVAALDIAVLKPYGRAHETESDLIGLELMAEAGFDPREAVNLWRNMARASGGAAPPEFMSTHPSHATRIADLQDRMDAALQTQQAARARGLNPRCR